MRTQRRTEREKTRQELIQQGLLEAPKPKVKLGNMMRVVAEQAVADPTAMEHDIRSQMAERQQVRDSDVLSKYWQSTHSSSTEVRSELVLAGR